MAGEEMISGVAAAKSSFHMDVVDVDRHDPNVGEGCTQVLADGAGQLVVVVMGSYVAQARRTPSFG